jgi:sulfur relay (sulfurtransferase) complex TusBCD TusD component (DsrE family)
LRLAKFSLEQGDQVKVFLIGKGVDLDKIDDKSLNVKGLAEEYQNAGGKIMACGTCLRMRNSTGSKLCPMSNMKTFYDIVRESDKVVSF